MEEVKEETNTTKKRKRSDPDISKDETPPKKNKKEKRLKKQGTKTSQEEESNLPLFFALRNLSASDEESHATSELLQSLRSTPLPSLLHQTNREGQTLLHLCLSLSPPSLPILSFFLDEMGRGGEEIPVGEWVDREDKRGETALHVGCRSGWLEGVRQLIKKGADLNGQTKGKKDTPLILACCHGREAVVRELVKRGADMSLTSRQGLDCYKWAEKTKNSELLIVLEEEKEKRKKS